MPRKIAPRSIAPFGPRLAQLRKEAGLTQRQLAAELEISQRMVAYYETQTEHPPTHLIAAIVEVLGISADELLGIKPMRAARPVNQRLLRRVRQMEKLPPKERKQLLSIIDTFLERERLASRQT